jgi:hypothetical protein
MNFQEFSDYIVNFLWKNSDAVVIAALPNFVKLAEAELNRTFKVEDRAMVVQLELTDNVVPVPADLRTIRNVHVTGFGDFSYAIPADFYTQQDAAQGQPLAVYTTVGKNIVLSVNADVNAPRTVVLTYWANIPDFAATDESWLCDRYLDVYTYCVLKHTTMFLREDERIGAWNTFFSDAFGSAMLENDEQRYAGSPLRMNFDFVG